ncbi:hypothetical protein KAR91_73415 [Candidatus Pacearchaeota archaeon]|nr:hypothetical protein [Candidatus Pacearchaeota archaeon]
MTTKAISVEVTRKERTEIKKVCDGLVAKSKRLKITTVAQEDKAIQLCTEIKKKEKQIEEKRKKITVPLNTALKETNNLFKEITQPLRDAIRFIKDGILEFQLEAEKKALAEQQVRENREAAHKKQGHKVTVKAPITAEVGSSTISKVWTFEVISLKSVPKKFIIVDTVAVNKAIKDGERKIPGLRIFQKRGVSLR